MRTSTTPVTLASSTVRLLATVTVVLFATITMSATAFGQVAAWDFTGQSSPATVAATTFNANLVSTSGASNITRGAGAGASAATNSFRTTGFKNDGISTSNTDYFQVTLSAASGFQLSLSTIDANFNGTAGFFASPGVTSQFAYSLNGTTFTLIGSPVTSTSLAMTQINLTGISALQNVPSGTTITLRYYASGQTTTGGWGFFSSASGVNGLAIGGALTSTGIKAEPTNHPTSFAAGTPTTATIPLTWTDATGAVTPDGYLIKASTTSLAAISDPTDTNPVADDTDLSDGIGAKNITQGTGTYTFTGLSPSTTYFFKIYSYTNSGANINYKTDGTIQTASATTAALTAQVVINKFQNPGTTVETESVELLVVQDNLDMRGMIIKDFSSSNTSDGGGAFTFTTASLWSSVRKGTLIILRFNSTTPPTTTDVTTGGADYTLDVSLQDTTYFTTGAGSFNLSATEMVMIKSAGSGTSGVSGNLHTLASGAATTQFNSVATGLKLRSTTANSTSSPFVIANNSTSSLADFNGTDASVAASATFGSGNNASNQAYIDSLRGLTAQPTTQASGVTFTSVGSTSVTVNWTNGNGAGRIVLAKAGSAVNSDPVDGTSYTPNAAFGSGSQIGSGNFVVFSGSGSSVIVTNLSPNTTYHFAVYEFSGSGTTINYLTSAPAIGNVATTKAATSTGLVSSLNPSFFGQSVTFTANVSGTGGTPSGTVTFTVDGIAQTPVSLSGGSAQYITSSLAVGTHSITAAYSGDSSFNGSTSSTLTQTVNAIPVIISEFRFAGPGGSTDEFIELYNTTNASFDISGYQLLFSDNSPIVNIPASTTPIPAHGHYLLANNASQSAAPANNRRLGRRNPSIGVAPADPTVPNYSLTAVAGADQTYTTDIAPNAGVAFQSTGANAFRLDSVGFTTTSPQAGFVEGTGLTPTFSAAEYSYARKIATTGFPQDTDNNVNDFWLVTTNTVAVSDTPAVLGAPGPENLVSPINRTSQLKSSLLDGSVASTTSPNQVRDSTVGTPGSPTAFGTLTLRRRFTNTTGTTVSKLRLRITNISTTNSPGAGTAQADVRMLTSIAETITVNNVPVDVRMVTLEAPAVTPPGGGYNVSLLVDLSALPGGVLANGDNVAVNITLGVAKGGTYRLAYIVEAVTP
jgi:hypothetical protein